MSKYNVKNNYLSENVVKKYDRERFGHFIGWVIDKRERAIILEALHFCNAKKNDSICDVACGTGRFSEELIQKGFAVMGADYSLQMLKEAKRKKTILERIKGLVAMDASAMAFKNESFHFMISMRFFGHIPSEERKKILKENLRIVKNNLIVEYFSLFSLHTLYKFVKFLVTGTFYGYSVTKKSLKNEVESVGLQIAKIIPMMSFFHQGWVVVLKRAK